jgi:hypothetical protein
MISEEDVDGIATTIGTIHILRQYIFGSFLTHPSMTYSRVQKGI